jgi:hypothetical protein
MENSLIKQLEDKKKELNSIDKRLTNLYKQNRLKQYAELFNKYAIRKAEIAILEQAIAEIEKQRQEEIKFLEELTWVIVTQNLKKLVYNRIEQLNQPKTEE